MKVYQQLLQSIRENREIKEAEVEDYVSLLLEILVLGKVSIQEVFRRSQLSTSPNRLETIHKYLPQNLNQLFKVLNQVYKKCIRPIGSASLDETM